MMGRSCSVEISSCLVRKQFGFAEMTGESLKDPAILALAEKVDAVTDTKSLYPTYCSGGAYCTRHPQAN